MFDTYTQIVRSARSRRRYVSADPIPRDLVLKLVDLARISASAVNFQPLRYRVVSGKEACEQVFGCTNWGKAAGTPQAIPPDQRPTGYIVILSAQPVKFDPAIDLGIAAQTIQLGAAAAGYASCMVASMDREALHRTLQLPPNLKVELLLTLGRPAEKVVLEDLPSNGEQMFWRSEDGVWHVAKRRLEDVLV